MPEPKPDRSHAARQTVPIPWWGWLGACVNFTWALLAPPPQFMAFAILGVGAAVTCLQVSRRAVIPLDRRRNFVIGVTLFAGVAAVMLRSMR